MSTFTAFLAATRIALESGVAEFRECRRIGGESPEFRQAFSVADSVTGWLRRGEAELLFELARAVPAKTSIVEIGSYLGRSTAFFALGAPEGVPVFAIDPHTGDRSQIEQGLEGLDTSKQFIRNIQRIGVSGKVVPRIMTSSEAAAVWDGPPIGLLFIDGWHSEDAVYQDGLAWLPHMAPAGVAIFDDYGLPEVWAAITRLVNDGVCPPLAGAVGKDAVTGPKSKWPSRVQLIARPISSRSG